MSDDGVLDFGECYAGVVTERALILKSAFDSSMVC
jgi:hypothetical protein